MTSLGTEDSDVKPFRGSGHILTTSRSTLVRPMHKKALFRYVASQILFWCGEGLQTVTWLSYQYGGIFNQMDIHPHPRVGLFLLWTLPNSFDYQECIISAATLWSCWLKISADSHAHIICVLVVYGSTPPYLCHTSSICACLTSRCLLLKIPKLTRMFLCNKNLPG